MKKSYSQPALTVYGNVEQLTQANRANNNTDSFNYTGPNLGLTPEGGSRDLLISN